MISNKDMLIVNIVSDSNSDALAYERLLNKHDLHSTTLYSYSDLKIKHKDIVIIFDISSLSHIMFVKEFVKKNKNNILVISSYSLEQINLHIDSFNGLYLSKPISSKVFKKIVSELKLKASKDKFLNKKTKL